MKRLALSLMTLACLPTVAAAAPVDPAHVSADAQWFLHLDIEAIGDMEIVQQWKAKIETKDRYKKMAERASEKLGMNPAEDLLGVTIYADKYEGETGVVLIYVQNVDREKMNELFNEKHPDHKTTKYGKRTIATWTAKHKHKEKEVSGTFASDGVILLASSVSEAKAALDVIDGKAKGLGEDSELLADVAKNPLLVSRAIDVPKDYRGLTKCPVLRLCTDAFAQWTADDGEIMGHYVLKAESPDIAENFKTIVDGIKAMGDLRYANVKPVKEVLDGLEYSVDDEVFELTFTTTTEELRTAVKEVMKRSDGKWKRYGKKHDKEKDDDKKKDRKKKKDKKKDAEEAAF